MKLHIFIQFVQRPKKRTVFVECKGCGKSVRIYVPIEPTAVILKKRITAKSWETTETGMYCRECRKGVKRVVPVL